MAKAIEGLGPTGARVGERLSQIRRSRGLTLKAVESMLTELGRPIALSALSKIELGHRRVDTDDLVALALALDVSPNALLLPDRADPQAEAVLTPSTVMDGWRAWQWATKDRPMPHSAREQQTIFISYAQADGSEWAEWLAATLKGQGFSVWYDRQRLRLGTDLTSAIEEGLQSAAFVIAIMTPAYTRSKWSHHELASAIFRSSTTDRIVLPLRVAEVDPPPLLATRVWLDLTTEDMTEQRTAKILHQTLTAAGIVPDDRNDASKPRWPKRLARG